MTTSLLGCVPRSVLRVELAARAASSGLYPGLAGLSVDDLRTRLTGDSVVLKGQHGPDDNRHEPHVYGNAWQRRCADGVAAIVPGSALVHCGSYWILARSGPCIADDTSLCDWEHFSKQPRFGCKVIEPRAWSACLVHESHVLTCWHQHERTQDEQHYAVFGFTADRDIFFEPRFPNQDVVPLTKPVYGSGSNDEDWVIFGLARPVTHRPALTVAEMPASWWKGKPRVYTLGHPIDLPMKLADDAWAAQHPKIPARFVAPLDTYGGCSGSPVIAVTDDDRHVVMGIVLEGQLNEPNFDRCESGCWYRHVYRYEFPEVIGQVCMHARFFEKYVAKLHES